MITQACPHGASPRRGFLVPQPRSSLGLCLSQNSLLTPQRSLNPAPQLSGCVSLGSLYSPKTPVGDDNDSGATLSEPPWVLQVCPAPWNHAEGQPTACREGLFYSLNPSSPPTTPLPLLPRQENISLVTHGWVTDNGDRAPWRSQSHLPPAPDYCPTDTQGQRESARSEPTSPLSITLQTPRHRTRGKQHQDVISAPLVKLEGPATQTLSAVIPRGHEAGGDGGPLLDVTQWERETGPRGSLCMA